MTNPETREPAGDFYVHLYTGHGTDEGMDPELTSSPNLFRQAPVTVVHFCKGQTVLRTATPLSFLLTLKTFAHR